jgi:hypothetical protein
MRVRTMLAGLAVAAILAGGAFAADGGAGGGGGAGGRGGRGGFGGFGGAQTLKWADFKFATAPANADTAVLNGAIYQAAALAKLPEGADQDAAKTAIDARFIAIATAAGVANPTAATLLSQNQYYKGVVESTPARGAGRGGAGGRGGRGGAGGGRGGAGGGAGGA